MTHTGQYDINKLAARNDSKARTIETILAHAERVEQVTGNPVKHRKLDAARKSAALLAAARKAASDLQTTAAERLAETAKSYRAGKATATDLALQAATLATAGTAGEEVRRLTENAVAVIKADAVRDALTIDEATWLNPIKARAAVLIDEATEVARRMDRKPREATPGIRSSVHPLEPTAIELKDINLRHDWERLEHLLNQLDDVHHLADELRMSGIVPIVTNRPLAEDYRWLHLDRLAGNPNRRREFWVANYDTGAPGVYLSTELEDAGGITHERHSLDAYSASAQAVEQATDAPAFVG